MREYRVEFYYNTDLRAEKEVTASDEVRALAVALDDLNISRNSWAISEDYWVKIYALYSGGLKCG